MVEVGRFDVGRDVFDWHTETPLQWQGKMPPTDGVHAIHVTVLPPETVRIAMQSAAGTGLIFALICLTLNIAYRKKKVIKISSPLLNNFIAIGCIHLYVLIILYGVDTSDMSSMDFTVQCHARPLLLSLGVSLAFGAIFMKNYRVFAIFKRAVGKFKQIHVDDTRLICGISIMVILDIITSVTWIIVDSMYDTIHVLRTEMVTDENGHDFRYVYMAHNCYSKYSMIWVTILFIYKTSLLVFGVFLAWEIRSVKIKSLNESRQIALSVYVVALVSFIYAPVQYFMDDNVTFIYVFTSISIFAANTIVLGLAFVPKIRALRRNEDEVNTSTMEHDTEMDKNRSVRRLTVEFDKKVVRLAALKVINHQLSTVLPEEDDDQF
ncbi:gamma-aminobutyric acid type B receptor subunit 2-like [Glandiceps talaboti]